MTGPARKACAPDLPPMKASNAPGSSPITSAAHSAIHQQDQTTSEELTMEPVSANTAGDPRIIIVGGGFGGLAAARALRKS